jgi:hypothetical protein
MIRALLRVVARSWGAYRMQRPVGPRQPRQPCHRRVLARRRRWPVPDARPASKCAHGAQRRVETVYLLMASGVGFGQALVAFAPDREPFMRRRRTDTRSKATLGSLLKGPGHRRVYHAQLRTTATDAKNAAAAIMTMRKPFGIELPMRACLHMTSPTA